MSAAKDPYADLKQHRWSEIKIPAGRVSSRSKRHNSKRHQHFIMVPWRWVQALQGVRASKTYHVVFHVLYLHWRENGGAFRVSKVDGVSRASKWRALAYLERAGLIEIERRPRRAPIVRILL